MFFKLLGASSLLLFYGCTGTLSAVSHAYAQDIQNTKNRNISTPRTLSVKILNEDNLSGIYTVNHNDELTLPLIGTVLIKGQTLSQIESLLTQRYADGYLINPIIKIHQVINQNDVPPILTKKEEPTAQGGIYILGGVKNPGRYNLPVDAHHILHAIALAGGYTGRANAQTFEIIRDNEKLKYTAETYKPMVADIIIVKERLFWAGNR